MKHKLFAAAIMANRVSISRTRQETAAIAIKAINEAEAVGLGIKAAKEQWPYDNGYTQHQAAVQEIDPSYFGMEYVDGEWRETSERG